MEVNLNDRCRVRLSDFGRRYYARHYARVGLTVREDVDGWTSMQLHELMNVFGSCLWLGNPDLPFVDMVIRIGDE